ncbi:MAG: Uridylate kinase [Candidatus Methanofastidiosum methylothiophilum]|uniref:Uridylate kinase n=1 Tax=Candidatus Methanofastidiosum methylothiophilum TaxID=1705564 RepID=A0A150J0M3_9EURY|nr:MAG: Uridylate kinase [Candidatus Methanofastidiosum methylthiophilus]NMC76855.1 UMP kinase [Candidatus Methanofastidiosa archaeon]
MRIVLKIGGSIVFPNKIDVDIVKNVSKQIVSLSKNHEFLIVVGGGAIAREYIGALKYLGKDDTFLDFIGMEAACLNASLFMAGLGDKAPAEISRNFKHALTTLQIGRIPLLGGTHPGHTTDAVSSMLAEFVGADLFLRFTNVDGVYDKDPKKFSDAKKLAKISHEKLLEIVQDTRAEAGVNAVIDPLAAKILKRAKIKTIVVGKDEIKNIKEVIEGKHKGTEIS